MKGHRLALGVIAVVVLGALGVIAFTVFGKDTSIQYTTVPASRGMIEQTVSSSGALNPVTLVNVGTQISGVVKAMHADYNSHVEKDHVLAELDQSLLQAQIQQSEGNLASAQANLKQAKANYERNRALYAKDYVAKADLEAAQQSMETAEAQVKVAQGQVDRDHVNLGYTVIRSPVSGVVVSRNVDVGQTVAASFQTPTLFTIAQDLKKMQIDTNLSEADVGAVKEGMKVRFTVDAFQGRQFEGQVRQIRLNPTTVQNVVTYDVVIDVNNDDLSLLPGMTSFVTIIEDEKDDVLRIPSGALTYRPADANTDWKTKRAASAQAHGKEQAAGDEKPHEKRAASAAVYVLRDGKPQRVRITTGITTGKLIEVVEGDVKEGDAIITDEFNPNKKATPATAGPAGRGGPRLF